LRLTFSGPRRFADAAARWREIAAIAEVDDTVKLPGTGLVALGTFAFDDQSRAESVLIVPRVLIARHRGAAWATRISRAEDPAEHDSGAPAKIGTEPDPAGPWPGTDFAELTPASLEAYLDGVREATARVERGELEKIVLARRMHGALPAAADLRVQ